MALLWTHVAAQQHEAMAWYNDGSVPRQDNKPVSVRKAGFAGYVGGGYDFADHKESDEQENRPDLEDEELHTFIASDHNEPSLWRSKGRLGQVDISKGVYATQSHVNQFHLDRYRRDRTRKSWNDNPGYLGTDHPMFITHQGRLHAIEGHHRVAVDLMSGQGHTIGWHYDADKHGLPHDEDEGMSDEEYNRMADYHGLARR